MLRDEFSPCNYGILMLFWFFLMKEMNVLKQVVLGLKSGHNTSGESLKNISRTSSIVYGPQVSSRSTDIHTSQQKPVVEKPVVFVSAYLFPHQMYQSINSANHQNIFKGNLVDSTMDLLFNRTSVRYSIGVRPNARGRVMIRYNSKISLKILFHRVYLVSIYLFSFLRRSRSLPHGIQG